MIYILVIVLVEMFSQWFFFDTFQVKIQSEHDHNHIRMILVLSKCFRAGFWPLLTCKYSVKGGANSCKLCVILKLKIYLISVSGIVVHSVCNY